MAFEQKSALVIAFQNRNDVALKSHCEKLKMQVQYKV